MKIEKVNINDLISPAYNPREITTEEMEKLKTSIKEFGYVDPIIVNEVNNHIVGGNQRYEALKEMDYEEVDVVYVHEEDLTREKALNIALNKISGNWDFDKLGEIFNEMAMDGFDISFTGFDDFEINNQLGFFDDEFNDYTEMGEADENFDETFEEYETYLQEATFELKEDDEYNFDNFKITINDQYIKEKIRITLYQDTIKLSLENLIDEDLLKEFLNKNPHLKDRLRNNGQIKSDIYG